MPTSASIQSELSTLQSRFDSENTDLARQDEQIQKLTMQANQKRQQVTQLQDQIAKKTNELHTARQQEAQELERQADALRKAS